MTGSTLLRLTPPSVHAGAWAERLRGAPSATPLDALDVTPGDSLLVVVAHPDDETLAMGATLAELAAQRVDVHVVALTSGEASLDHVGRQLPELAGRRRAELASAGGALGVRTATALGLPDSALAGRVDDAVASLSLAIRRHGPSRLVTLWRDDPHPDHRAAFAAASTAGRVHELPVTEMPLWAMHWTDPDDVSARPLRIEAGPDAQAARARAVASYVSQTEPLADDLEPILPRSVTAWTHECVLRP